MIHYRTAGGEFFIRERRQEGTDRWRAVDRHGQPMTQVGRCPDLPAKSEAFEQHGSRRWRAIVERGSGPLMPGRDRHDMLGAAVPAYFDYGDRPLWADLLRHYHGRSGELYTLTPEQTADLMDNPRDDRTPNATEQVGPQDFVNKSRTSFLREEFHRAAEIPAGAVHVTGWNGHYRSLPDTPFSLYGEDATGESSTSVGNFSGNYRSSSLILATADPNCFDYVTLEEIDLADNYDRAPAT